MGHCFNQVCSRKTKGGGGGGGGGGGLLGLELVGGGGQFNT